MREIHYCKNIFNTKFTFFKINNFYRKILLFPPPLSVFFFVEFSIFYSCLHCECV